MDAVTEQVPGLEITLQEIADKGIDTFIEFEKPQQRQLSVADLELLLAQTATEVAPGLSLEDCRQMFRFAIQKAIAKHPDLPAYVEAMLVASLGLLPYVWRVTWDEFVEAVYCIARHADFLQSARARSLLAQVPAGAYIQ